MFLEGVVLGVEEEVFLESETALRRFLRRVHCIGFVPDDEELLRSCSCKYW